MKVKDITVEEGQGHSIYVIVLICKQMIVTFIFVEHLPLYQNDINTNPNPNPKP